MSPTDEQIMEAIQQQRGNLAAAARSMGCHRNTLYNRIQASEELRACLNDQRECMIDLAENKLLQKIEGGDIRAIIFFLKTQGRKRGYIQRYEQHLSSSAEEIISHELRQAALDDPETSEALFQSLEKRLDQGDAE